MFIYRRINEGDTVHTWKRVYYKAWKFYIPSTKQVVISERDDFDEHHFPGLKQNFVANLPNKYYPLTPLPEVVQMPDLGGVNDNAPHVAPAEPIIQAPAPAQIPDIPEPNLDIPNHSPSPEVIHPPLPPQQHPEPLPDLPRCSSHVRNPPGEWWKLRNPPPQVPDDSDDELGFTVIDIDPDLESREFAGISAGTDPCTFKQAMNSPDVVHWKKAMLEGINAHLKNGTWNVVRLPEGEKPIGSGWIFKIK
jgi:hypothetical protein